MIKAAFVSSVLTACASAAVAAPQTVAVPEGTVFRSLSGPTVPGVPPESYRGQHFTNALGCVYSRTQAPGYGLVWHVIARTRAPDCPNTLPGAQEVKR